MDTKQVNGSFISAKISKVRWLPEEHHEADSFLTGSWGCLNNHVKLWRLVNNQYSEDDGDVIPKVCGNVIFPGDVSGLEFVDYSTVAASSSEGYVSLINIARSLREESLIEKHRTSAIHNFHINETNNLPSPCTGISVFNKDIASIGEDGRINVLTSLNLSVIRTVQSVDSCSLTAVSYVNHENVLVGNRMGLARKYDLRVGGNKPTASLIASCEDNRKCNGITYISYHPAQEYITLLGTEEGSLTVWDLRRSSSPASYISAHIFGITELRFHKSQPTMLFTASENGELFQWNQSQTHHTVNIQDQIQSDTANFHDVDINPWLNEKRAKSEISVVSIISGLRKAINSFDVLGPKLICGCDNEAVYFVNNLY